MDEALRALIIALIGVAVSFLTSYGLVIRARGESAKEQVKADLARQAQELAREAQKTERDKQFNASLEEFRTLYAQERLIRIQKDTELGKLYTDFRLQEERVRVLEQTQREYQATVKRLEEEIAGLKERIAALHVTLAAAEQARDDALQLVEAKNKELAEALDLVRIRNGELKEARDTVERVEQLLQDQTFEMSKMRERLDTLEALEVKKVDTSNLDGSKVPDSDPVTLNTIDVSPPTQINVVPAPEKPES